MTEATESHWCVYIVECNDGSLYTGVTNNLDNRIKQHNQGIAAAKYTRARRPVELRYTESGMDKVTAMQREYAIKQLSRLEKLLLIKNTDAV